MRSSSFIPALALLLLPCRLGAQEPLRDTSRSILREILSSRETDLEIIAKSRAVLLDCVRQGDTTKAHSILAYLRDRYRGTRYLPLWPAEQILLSYWTADYRTILRPSWLESLDTLEFSHAVVPPHDMLLDDLRDALRPVRMDLRVSVLRAPLETHESEFLLLFLESLLGDRSDPGTRTMLNEDADAFLSRFADSPYAPFVRRDIRYVLRESPWGYGFVMGLGGGAIGGNLSTRLSDPAALDIGFDLALRRLILGRDAVLYLRAFIGLGSTVRSPFAYNGDWLQGMKQDVDIPEVSLGVVVYESDAVQVAPFAGISGIFISPPRDNNGNKVSDLELDLSSWSAGLNADWKIAPGAGLFSADADHGYWLIRTRLTFASVFAPPDQRFSGNIVTFTVGIGMFGRTMSREL